MENSIENDSQKEGKYHSISYYAERFDLIWVASSFILVSCIVYFILLFAFDVIKVDIPNWFKSISTEAHWYGVSMAATLVIIYLMISLTSHLGSRDRPITVADDTIFVPTPKKSLYSLILATFLFILMVSLPIAFLGGSRDSCFGTILITICSLIVIIAKSNKVRLLFINICMTIYAVSGFVFVSIIIIKNGFYTVLYLLMIIASIAVTYRLSKTRSSIIFERQKNL